MFVILPLPLVGGVLLTGGTTLTVSFALGCGAALAVVLTGALLMVTFTFSFAVGVGFAGAVICLVASVGFTANLVGVLMVLGAAGGV